MSDRINNPESRANNPALEDFIYEKSPERSPDGFNIETRDLDWFLSGENSEGNPDHLFILLAGTSESGKSHFGDHFVKSETGNRLKFYKLLRLTPGYDRWSSGVENPDPFKYASYLDDKEQERDEAFAAVLDQINEIEDETRCTISSLETIKHPWINQYFGRMTNTRTINVFIDAPLETRIDREAKKTGHDVDSVRINTIKKDLEKKDYGNEGVFDLSNIVINNGGSLEDYNTFITLFH